MGAELESVGKACVQVRALGRTLERAYVDAHGALARPLAHSTCTAIACAPVSLIYSRRCICFPASLPIISNCIHLPIAY